MCTNDVEVKRIQVIFADGTSAFAELEIRLDISDDEDLVSLTLTFGERQIKANHENLFMALQMVRLELENENTLLCCYGVSVNVYPSPMILGMGVGYKAYKLKMGQSAKLQDLVGIFDTGPDVVPATVVDQEKFYSQWIASIMSKK